MNEKKNPETSFNGIKRKNRDWMKWANERLKQRERERERERGGGGES